MNNKSSSSPDDKLDRLLQDWSAKQTPTAGDIDALRKHVVSAVSRSIDQPSSDALVSVALSSHKSSARFRLAWVALAASLLVGLLIWKQASAPQQKKVAVETRDQQTSKVADASQTKDASQPARPPHPFVDFSKQKLLMRKLLSVYDQPLMWIAESPESLHVELSQSPDQAKSEAQQPWLLIRLTVEPQDSRASDASVRDTNLAPPLWQLDLVVRNEQKVNLTEGTKQDEQLAVWPYVTEDGLVMIDTQFAGLGPMKTQGNQTNLVRPGSRTRLTSVDDQYALCQYVEVIY